MKQKEKERERAACDQCTPHGHCDDNIFDIIGNCALTGPFSGINFFFYTLPESMLEIYSSNLRADKNRFHFNG